MKINYFLALFTILISCSASKNHSKSNTKISILGSVHFPTKNINADSLYNVLNKFEPDIILTEIGKENMYEDFTFKKLYNENEIVAVVRYKMNHPKAQLRPIDLFERNNKRKEIGLFSEASAVFQTLNKLNRDKSFTNKEQIIWNKFSDYWQKSDEIAKDKLIVINSDESDRIVDSLIQYQYFKIREIININTLFDEKKLLNAKNDSVSQRDYFTIWSDFEMNRNKAIAENVLKCIKKNPHKRIIILIGFKHRFFIRKYLEAFGIEVTEYYE